MARMLDFKGKLKSPVELETKMRFGRTHVPRPSADTTKPRPTKIEENAMGNGSKITVEDLPGLVKAAGDFSQPAEQLEALTKVRDLLGPANSPHVDKLIELGVLHTVVECLKRDDTTDLQLQATWIALNITAGAPRHTEALLAARALPVLIKLVDSPELNDLALWTLGNIIGDRPKFRRKVLHLGFLPKLLALIKDDAPEALMTTCAFVIANLCRRLYYELSVQQYESIVSALNVLLGYSGACLLHDAVSAVCYIMDESLGNTRLVIVSGMVPKLIGLLAHGNLDIQVVALRALGCLTSGSHFHTQVVLDNGLLTYMDWFLGHSNEFVREVSCWLVAQVVGGPRKQANAVFDNRLHVQVIGILRTGRLRTQRQALLFVNNVVSAARTKHVYKLVRRSIVGHMCALFDSDITAVTQHVLSMLLCMLQLVQLNGHLNAMKKCLVRHGAKDRLEALRHHSNGAIAKSATNIIDRFFSAFHDHSPEPEDNVEKGLAPNILGSEFKFAPHDEKDFDF